ncbi:MAG: polysaccharide deacetylase family protein [Firmicutes bacterium]|nr:polysaccharide deacetylase family protein [Bacillota bacterium]
MKNNSYVKRQSRKVVAIFAIVAIALVGLLVAISIHTHWSYAIESSGEAISWGVTPNKEGRTPEPPKNGAKMLEDFGGMFVMPRENEQAEDMKKVYFTFDLGYEAGYTAEVLDILKEHNIKGVFFLCGNYIKEEALIKRMLVEGHEIGNHTDKHKDLPMLSNEAITKDIADFDIKYKEAFSGSSDLRFFRPPKGRFCKRTLEATKEQNLKCMMWSIAIVDWGKEEIDAKKSADKITSRLHDGAIILLHITNAGTPKMLRQLIPQMQQAGYSAGNF